MIAEDQPFSARLQSVMSALRMKPAAFAKELGINPSSLSTLTGPRSSEPRLKTLSLIVKKIPGVSANFLLTGQGEPLHRSMSIIQEHNTGNVIGQMTGGAVHYTVEECRQELDECRQARAQLTNELAAARGRIIELLDKTQAV